MPKVYGKILSKQELLRFVGSTNQLFGIQPVEYFAGPGNKNKAYQVDTGGGLQFDVLENRCLDLFNMRYKGVNLAFVSKSQMHSTYNSDFHGSSYPASQGCGILYTAGLRNVGPECSVDGVDHYSHGAVKHAAAQNVCARGMWHGDDYKFEISGEMREAAFFGCNLALHRTINTSAFSKTLQIRDVITNEAYDPEDIMLLYHLNTGFPLVMPGAELVSPIREIHCRNEYAEQHKDRLASLLPPGDDATEAVYTVTVGQNASGYTASALLNRELNLGLYIKYPVRHLDKLVIWKSMHSGDYAYGILPSNCYPEGIQYQREHGGAKSIQSFESWTIDLEIGILDGQEEMDRMAEEIRAMQ